MSAVLANSIVVIAIVVSATCGGSDPRKMRDAVRMRLRKAMPVCSAVSTTARRAAPAMPAGLRADDEAGPRLAKNTGFSGAIPAEPQDIGSGGGGGSSGNGMNSSRRRPARNSPARQSAFACSMRSGRDDTKFHQM